MRALSIRARLTAAFAAAMLAVLALAALFVYLRVSDSLGETIDSGLRSRADDLSALLEGSSGSPPEIGGDRLLEGDESFSQILAADGEVLASTLRPGAGAALTPGEAERAAREPLLLDDRDVPGIESAARILARSARAADGRELIVVAGTSIEDRDEALAGLASAFAIGAPMALLLASGLGYLLAGRALAPIEAMRRRAAQITLERSGERLPLPAAEDEVRRLGETLNEMLDRIEGSLERERVFVADASHELRTPLAILRAELELAERPGRSPEELRAAIASTAEEVERLSRLAEDLLVIARSDQGRLPIKRERANLAELLERVRTRFAARAGEAARPISIEAPAGASADLDPIRIEQALGNLVDNALRHGEGEIHVAAAVNGAETTFAVSDQGRGIPQAFEARAFERFTRADEGRTGAGSGLGLAIVRAVAEAHGGEATVKGSRVTVLIPI